jgi:hypothetical protein
VYAVAQDPRSDDVFVADAGGNTVLRVRGDQVVDVWVLPPVLQEVTAEGLALINQELPPDGQAPDCLVGLEWAGNPVPTSVTVGPDRALYVTTLPGFPEQPGTGKVFRIDPSTGQVTVWADGFTSAVDLSFDPRGTAYVAEIFGGANGAGAIKKVATTRRGGVLRAGAITTVAEAMPFPGGNDLLLPIRVVAAPDGALYVANNLFGVGNVLKITP